MEENKTSPALEILTLVWRNCPYNSHREMNVAMSGALQLAISAGIPFYKDDFEIIHKKFRPSYWMGVSSNGYHYGERFYHEACRSNPSCIIAWELYYKRTAFILDGKRFYDNSRFIYNNLWCHVTGWNETNDKIMFVGYTDGWDKGTRKLFNMDKKEWLQERKLFKVY